MKLAFRICAATAALAMAAGAQASDFVLSGTSSVNTDVAMVDFSLASAGEYVGAWTDSFLNGANFDPNIMLWQKQGSDYVLVAQNDDNPDLGSTQTAFDAGLQMTTLAAGDYRVSISLTGNDASGGKLSQGFTLTGTSPTALSSGGFWRLNLTNVDSASVVAVPEPESWALMLAGLAGLGVMRRRRMGREPADSLA